MPRSGLLLPVILIASFVAGLYYLSATTGLPVSLQQAFPSLSVVFMGEEATTHAPWTSSFEGWYNRLTPHPSPDSFTPAKENLLLAVLRNSRVEPEGFTLAIFSDGSDKALVDSDGRLFVFSNADDASGLLQLAESAKSLPKPDKFRNTWQIKSPVTGQPIERIVIPHGGELDQISVQGFKKEKGAKPELKAPVGEHGSLPSKLSELTGLVLEAREDHHQGQESPLVKQVLDLVDVQ